MSNQFVTIYPNELAEYIDQYRKRIMKKLGWSDYVSADVMFAYAIDHLVTTRYSNQEGITTKYEMVKDWKRRLNWRFYTLLK